MPSRLRVSALMVCLAAPQWAQERINPFDNAAAAEQGQALFQTHCTYCHGVRGEGGRGPDLTAGRYRRGGTDAILFASIRNGIPGTEMPAVRATEEEVWKMVAFVRKIGAAGSIETAAGDAASGKAIYLGKGGCTACHAIGGEGGYLGPELDGVGRRRNLAYLLESMVAPDADVPIRYRAVRVVARSGESVLGTRLNEDDVSIQLRDERGNMRSFFKERLREIRLNNPSLMPSYQSSLAKKELDDLVAYLSTLRGPQ